ncbi:DUF418 domain-containing protein [Runella slithyformis]|uniref:DUF418 domain-containing protein n=1 Tax=Runella slithyformis TaxID=106 RepID=UPI00146AC476|nr:DUF418 domain-containing protein [Runella slithyformis]
MQWWSFWALSLEAAEPKPWLNLLMSALYDIHCLFLTFFYIVGVTLLLQKQSWQGALQNFAAIGKLALTTQPEYRLHYIGNLPPPPSDSNDRQGIVRAQFPRYSCRLRLRTVSGRGRRE